MDKRSTRLYTTVIPPLLEVFVTKTVIGIMKCQTIVGYDNTYENLGPPNMTLSMYSIHHLQRY